MAGGKPFDIEELDSKKGPCGQTLRHFLYFQAEHLHYNERYTSFIRSYECLFTHLIITAGGRTNPYRLCLC